jgi:cation diffusion facilitator family transporter
MAATDTRHVIQSLIANFVIALAKGVAALFTGSGAMLAETLHSLADCSNQLLLLFGIKRSLRPPSETHPLGYGRAIYFWSFLVAVLLFSAGGVFSVYEGVHKLQHPEGISKAWLGLSILGFSLVVEGLATLSNIRELNRRRGTIAFFRFLRQTKDSGLVVVFGENFAAVVGLSFALCAFSAAAVTGDGRYDAAGSLAIGLVLIGVAIFLAVEVKSLLLGERADPAIEAAVRELAKAAPEIEEVFSLLTLQQGPGEVLLAMKIRLRPDLRAGELCEAINRFEAGVKSGRPDVRWCFIEPDVRN